MQHLSAFEIELLRKLQDSLPLCQRPFAEVAKTLHSTEEAVLQSICGLKADGIIRRFSAHLNYRSLGFIASLVAAHVPDEKFRGVSAAVSALPGVSHSYCRSHHYNLWFTLQARSLIAVDVCLDGLRDEFDLAFHSLPAVSLFKLDVRFDPAGPRALAKGPPQQERIMADVPPIPVELDDSEKKAAAWVQDEIVIGERPFECPDVPNVLPILEALRHKGVLGKIAAVLDYHKLGYNANALFCAKVPGERVVEVGRELASFSLVSHCYERRTFDGWPFNLYAMCHAADNQVLNEFARTFCAEHELASFQVLPTVSELKKQPVRIIL